MYQPIAPLSTEAQARIKSSVQITSLNDVVLGLVQNSFDAHSTSIHISVDFSKGYCVVQDDGHGIIHEEFTAAGRLAEPYCTSRSEQDTATYGRHGQFLATLAGVSLLSITARHNACDSANRIILNDRGRLASYLNIDELDHTIGRSGTQVVVRGLFGKLPVRVKHLVKHFENTVAVDREFDTLKLLLVGLIVAHPEPHIIKLNDLQRNRSFLHKPVSIESLKLSDDGQSFRMEQIASTLHQAGFVERPNASLEVASILSASFTIEGAFSLVPMPFKHAQFMSVDHRPLSKIKHASLFSVVNSAFEKSTFGAEPQSELDDEKTQKQFEEYAYSKIKPNKREVQMRRRTIDRWPMFYIRINTVSTNEADFHSEQPAGRETSKSFNEIAELIKSLTKEFLLAHGFSSRNRHQEKQRRTKHSAKISSATAQVPVVTTPFSDWARIKASRDFPVADLLNGLPFREKVRPGAEIQDRSEVSRHSTAKRLQGWEAESENLSSPKRDYSYASEAVSEVSGIEEQPLEWIEPQTGKKFLLNPRTGTIIRWKEQIQNDCIETQRDHDNLGQDSVCSKDVHERSRLPTLVENLEKLNQLPSFQHTESPIHTPKGHRSLDFRAKLKSKAKGSGMNGVLTKFDAKQKQQSGSKSRISKESWKQAEVVGQVDQKYVLITLPSSMNSLGQSTPPLLVVVDQHAADERYRVEKLHQSMFEDSEVVFASPLVFEISEQEAKRLEALQEYFIKWKCFYYIDEMPGTTAEDEVNLQSSKSQVRITALPDAIAERCRTSPRLVIDMLRHEIWSDRDHSHFVRSLQNSDQSWLHSLHRMPMKMLEMLNSRACRSSIMFNDPLTMDECKELVQQLNQCQLPFQCAHGRPSISVIADLDITGVRAEAGNGEVIESYENNAENMISGVRNENQQETTNGKDSEQTRFWNRHHVGKRELRMILDRSYDDEVIDDQLNNVFGYDMSDQYHYHTGELETNRGRKPDRWSFGKAFQDWIDD